MNQPYLEQKYGLQHSNSWKWDNNFGKIVSSSTWTFGRNFASLEYCFLVKPECCMGESRSSWRFWCLGLQCLSLAIIQYVKIGLTLPVGARLKFLLLSKNLKFPHHFDGGDEKQPSNIFEIFVMRCCLLIAVILYMTSMKNGITTTYTVQICSVCWKI